MIVKNESAILERCLDAVRDVIDHIVISDTGSTDNTPDIIRDYLSRHNIPGAVYQTEWLNFGHNRTQSILRAKEWISDHADRLGISLDDNYFLTLDADMIGRCCSRARLLEAIPAADSWMVQQRNSAIQYDNMRLMRSRCEIRSVGVTHEYWKVIDSTRESKIDPNVFFIDDRGDGGCKSDKFTRDIRLLQEGLKADPDNIRYMFYLAQSYGDSGQYADALGWYQRRIDAGGWREERFIAHKRMGEIYVRLKQPEKAISEWLKGWEVMPSRVETLYEIIRHYRMAERYQTAWLFLEKALTIPLPRDASLFVEYPVYQYRLMEELSITAFYVNRRADGRIASQYIDLNLEVPEAVRQLAEKNSAFYMDPIEADFFHKKFEIEAPYRTGSSSLISVVDDKLIGVVRAVNYSISDEFRYSTHPPNGTISTKNYWAEGNEIYPIEFENDSTSRPVRISSISGLEDIRLCVMENGEHYGIGVSFEYGRNNHPSIVLLHFRQTSGRWRIARIAPVRFRDAECQKNWTLYSVDNRLHAVYSHSPLILLEISTEEATFGDYRVVREQIPRYNLSMMRGSANPVTRKGERLFLVHLVVHQKTRKYLHAFLRYDQDWNLVGVSEPFYLRTFFVEFSLSLLYDEATDRLTLPFSTRDATTEWAVFPYENIKWLPFIEGAINHIKASA